MSKRRLLILAVSVIFLSSAGIVTFLSAQDGGNASYSARGGVAVAETDKEAAVPEALETRFAPDRIMRTTGGALWRVSRDFGVLVSIDGGTTWDTRNQGLPMRAVYPFSAWKPPIITGLAVDPLDGSRLALSTLDAIYLSKDAGAAWQRVELKDPIKANDQLTCVALAPGNPFVLAVGTSFHGFFESTDGGHRWVSLSEPLAPLKLGGGTFEEIASLAYDPEHADHVWFSLGFGKGLFVYDRTAKTVDQLVLPPDPGGSPLRAIAFNRHGPQDPWFLEARTDDARWAWALPNGPWKLLDRLDDQVAIAMDKAQRMAAAAGKFGIYVSSRWASGDRLKSHLAFLKAQGLNSIILDFKDDEGYLTYDTKLDEPKRIGAVRQRFAIDDIVKTAHDNGLYLVGRIVTFRDKQLYNADNFSWAAWDKTIPGPWRYLKSSVDENTGQETLYQGEYWVDPYSEHVWDYKIDIGR